MESSKKIAKELTSELPVESLRQVDKDGGPPLQGQDIGRVTCIR